MHVDSYLEIFTTMYGWAFANIIGELLVGTGLFALPFLILAFQAWRDAKESASAGAAAVGLSESIQVKIILAIFVFSFCFATTPFTTLSNLSYTPIASATDPTPQTATAQDGAGVFNNLPQDSAISPTGSLSSVPMWWYLIMSLSAGTNDAIRSGITNAAVDFRNIQAMAHMAAINDPKLKADFNRFYSECYIPARSRYLRMNIPDDLSPNGQIILADPNYGATDVDWPGSLLFLTDPAFYPSMRSYNPVPGFALDPNDPYVAKVISDPTVPGVLPKYGWPGCSDWWASIRSRIADPAQSTMNGMLKKALAFAFPGNSSADIEDVTAKAAVINHTATLVDADQMMGGNPSRAISNVRTVAGALGLWTTGLTFVSVTMAFMHMVSALPMIQAFILMGIFTLLPLIVFLSGYKLEVMFYGAMAIFTVKFWTVLWFIAQWLDSWLYFTMYPNQTVFTFLQNATEGSLYKEPIFRIILFGLYIGLPVIWSGMMAWIGVNLGGALSKIMEGHAHPARNFTGMNVPIVGKFLK
jgi:hypothetical protein